LVERLAAGGSRVDTSPPPGADKYTAQLIDTLC
jgi:hypothetical protein